MNIKMPEFDVKKFVRDAGDAIGSNFHRVVQVSQILDDEKKST
jgi:hypothetical protein